MQHISGIVADVIREIDFLSCLESYPMNYVLCLYVQEDPSPTPQGPVRTRLQRFHIYRVAPPERTDPAYMLRVLDEYGEDYLYPVDCFVPVELSTGAGRIFARVAEKLTHQRIKQLAALRRGDSS